MKGNCKFGKDVREFNALINHRLCKIKRASIVTIKYTMQTRAKDCCMKN